MGPGCQWVINFFNRSLGPTCKRLGLILGVSSAPRSSPPFPSRRAQGRRLLPAPTISSHKSPADWRWRATSAGTTTQGRSHATRKGASSAPFRHRRHIPHRLRRRRRLRHRRRHPASRRHRRRHPATPTPPRFLAPDLAITKEMDPHRPRSRRWIDSISSYFSPLVLQRFWLDERSIWIWVLMDKNSELRMN